MKKFTLEELEKQEARAYGCESATIPGEVLRELIRLAIIGFDHDWSDEQ